MVYASRTKGLYAGLKDVDPLVDNNTKYYIDKNWKEGVQFSLKTVIKGGVMKLYYNGVLNQTISNWTRNDLYFKTGDYCTTDDDATTDYCEVLIHSITFSHK